MARKKQTTRKRKGHSGSKRARRFFGRTRIWTWESDRDHSNDAQNAVAVAKTVRGWESLPADIAQAVTRYQNNWVVCVRALCCTANGEEWVEEEVRIMRDQRLSDFQDLYHDLREKVLAAQRYDQVIDVGWIAGTWINDPKDEDLSLVDLGASSRARQLLWQGVDKDYRKELEAA